jgi:cytochrome c oxidase subunit 1
MIYELSSIGFLGLLVWAHHLFTTGLDVSSKAYFNAATSIIAIPTGVKIFSWCGTIYGGKGKNNIIQYYIIGFLILFTIGGLSGLMLSNASVDILVHDTYYVVAHFHYVLSLGAVIGVKLGYYIYKNIMLGVEKEFSVLSKIEFYTFFIGANLTFLHHHFLGLCGMPSRYVDYPYMYKKWHEVSSIGAIISLVSILIFMFIIFLDILSTTSTIKSYKNSISFFTPYINRSRTLDEVIERPSKYHHFHNTPLFI